jgi:hypothetical protein
MQAVMRDAVLLAGSEKDFIQQQLRADARYQEYRTMLDREREVVRQELGL